MSYGATLRLTLASIWTWLVLAISVLLVFVPVMTWRLLGWPFDRMNYYGGRLFRYTAIWTASLTPRWRFEVRGSHPANPRLPYVVVANHESFADILLLSHLPWEMKWLSKVSMMRVPIMGWVMWAAHDVPIHRGHSASAREALAACHRRLRGKVSVMIFPEGTRSRDEEMLPFKDGAFRLAIDAGVPILPLAIRGTRTAIAKHDWRIASAHAVVEILEPEPTAGLTHADVRELKERVRQKISVARERLKAELG
jgi:1-acyl-sn-glycerol-3-phosphate acyltransferase